MPDIVAHRGFHKEDPENSLAAMKAAWEAGFEWCECDIHLSADGEFVVIHDKELDRTTAGKGLVAAHSWEQLKRLALRDGAGQVSEEKLPSLQQLLDAMPSDGAMLIEIKPVFRLQDIQRLLEQVSGYRCMIQSFEHRNLELIHQCDERVWMAYLVGDVNKAIQEGRIGSTPAMGIYAKYSNLDPDNVGRMREAGKWIGAWTVNEEPEVQRLLAMNVGTIITDEPQMSARLMYGIR